MLSTIPRMKELVTVQSRPEALALQSVWLRARTTQTFIHFFWFVIECDRQLNLDGSNRLGGISLSRFPIAVVVRLLRLQRASAVGSHGPTQTAAQANVQ